VLTTLTEQYVKRQEKALKDMGDTVQKYKAHLKKQGYREQLPHDGDHLAWLKFRADPSNKEAFRLGLH
jgi:hypothetical protein